MSEPLVKDTENIKLGIAGMNEGNGHAYSWSAIINGYDKDMMKQCPYVLISDYMSKQPAETFGISGVKVTHIWTDNPKDAQKVAKTSFIPNIADSPEELIGTVDAVLITTDIGGEHVDRARVFVEAGVPVFIDKPLTNDIQGLYQFKKWIEEGKHILSSSSMKYAKELIPWSYSYHDMGELRFITVSMPKTWERYGIHALEAVFKIIGPGFISCRNTGTDGRDIVHIKHKKNIDIVIAVVYDMLGAIGAIQLIGTASYANIICGDYFFSFKKQLEAIVGWLRTGAAPSPFTETEELIKTLIAGTESKQKKGEEIFIPE